MASVRYVNCRYIDLYWLTFSSVILRQYVVCLFVFTIIMVNKNLIMHLVCINTPLGARSHGVC